ncbi:glycosyltransferase [Paenibacillus silvisoli]|uniref:glycosyltransferase n=1 Tax=Paenibacillus silvisoli TaxID=3110539 RepID=UPI0028060424|nr:glycosyltransferase [Paenibacillus silvisoli]
MPTRKIVIEINFNNYGMDPDRLSQPWLERRVALFRRLTLRSLLNQTNPNFLTVLKLADESRQTMESAVYASGGPFPDFIKFGTNEESTNVINSYIKGSDTLLLARIDSDDLYHRSFVQQLFDHPIQPGTMALINQDGYLWDAVGNAMAPTTHFSPSFYTYVYSSPEYAGGYRVKLPGKGHGYVIQLPHEILTHRNYVNVIHEHNTSRKKVPAQNRLAPAEIENVLREFMIPAL